VDLNPFQNNNKKKYYKKIFLIWHPLKTNIMENDYKNYIHIMGHLEEEVWVLLAG
jgi:hypothetical protein